MTPEGQDSSLDGLRSKLYDRDVPLTPGVKHSNLSPESQNVPKSWEGVEGQSKEENSGKKNSSMSFLTKLLLISFVFFILAIGAAGFYFYRGTPYVSNENITIEIDGPEEIKGGEVLNFQVSLTNNNNSDLEFAELVLAYPPGAVPAVGEREELKRARLPLGTIKSGQEEIKNLSIIIYGEKDSEHLLTATVEYRLSGSNAIFDKITEHKIKIISSPLDLTSDLLTEANSNQEISFTVNVNSNAAETVENLLLVVDYPPGFIFKSAVPGPSVASNGWKIGDLKPESKRTIKITGTLEGQDAEIKSFGLSVGNPTTDGNSIGLIYNSIFKTVEIKRPYVNLALLFNGKSGDEYLAVAGENIRIDLGWVNNLSSEISDAEVIMSLSGPMLDQREVSVSDGFYQSGANTITWNQRSNNELKSISPGGEGRSSFNLGILPISSIRGVPINNPVINMNLLFRGRRVTDGRASDTVEIKLSKKIKINSIIQLSGNLYHNDGPINNHGPIPPKVGQETTYTVIWSVVNAFNEARGAEVRATLPSYVKWLGKISPTDEGITFNANNGEVVWALGSVPAGRGYSNPPREVSFQIGITPSLSQVGQAPVLVSKATLRAEDAYTGVSLESSRSQLTTAFTEPGYRYGDEKVEQ